jgi:hypothetical protein
MLNPNSIVIQAQDKKRENLQWIRTESTLRQASSKESIGVRNSRGDLLNAILDFVNSLRHLHWLVLGHRSIRKGLRP